MSDLPISGLTALGATPAANDWLVVLDVSDTTMAGTGTDKKVLFSDLLAAEVTARAAADTAEATARANADTAEATTRGNADTAEAAARAAADALLIPLTQKGAASGVATLDGAGLIPSAQLPPITITDVFVVASEAAMLALTAQRGDVAVRTDLTPDGFFLLTTDSPGTLADWVQITAPGAVLSVDGRTGTVTLADLYDAAGAAATAQAFAIQRANHTGTQTASTVSDFDTQVRTSRLDQMAAPNTNLSIASHKLTNVTDPSDPQDAATKAYVDAFAAGGLVSTAVQTGTYAVAASDLVTFDTSGGAGTANLPATPANGAQVAIILVTAGNTLTVNCGGSDVFVKAGGATSKTMTEAGQVVWLQYKATGAIWNVLVDALPSFADGLGSAVNDATPGEVAFDVMCDVQSFLASGTWTPPAWTDADCIVEVEMIGAGGGGGGGRRGAAATVRGGGGGGGSGARARQSFLLGDLTTPVTVTIGAVGTAGVGATSVADGGAGGAGGLSTFGKYVAVSGGNGGAGGTATDGGAGGTGGSTRGMFAGVSGGNGGGLAAATAGTTSTTFPPMASGGGGGGGGFKADNTNSAPAAGGGSSAYTDGSTAGGAASVGGGLNGGNGVNAQFGMATGGGGGFRGNAQNGSLGGNGGGHGGGGGGGGGALDTNNGGNGGTGGVGVCRVVVHR